MTIKVNIEGIGDATFPDGTEQDVINKTVKDLVAKTNAQKQERYSGPTGQFKKIWDIANQEANTGGAAVEKAVEDPTGGNILRGVLGAVQWAASPLTAIGKGVFSDPVKIVSRALGAPEGVTEFVGSMAENVDVLLPWGAAVKTAMGTKALVENALSAQKTLKSVQLAEDIKNIIKSKTTDKPLKFSEGMPEGLVEEVQKRIGGTKKNVMAEEFVSDLVNAVKDKVGPKWVPSEKRITQELADSLVKNPEDIQDFLKRFPDYTPEKLSAELIETMSTSGRNLSVMGKWATELKKSFKSPDMQRIATFMENELPTGRTLTDKFWDGAKSIENTRRGLLVGQVATAMRNAITQSGRVGIGAVDDAFQGSIKGLMGSAGEGVKETIVSSLRGLGEGLDSVNAIVSRLRPVDRKMLINILDQDAALKSKASLFGTSVHEVTLGSKIGRIVNTLNTTQEYFFRNIGFQSKLDQILKASGIKGGIKGVNPADIPESAFKEATQYALEMTFSAMPKSKFGQEWVKSMSNPIFTALANPFPRFLWGNALPFLKEFSPIGFLEALSPKVIADLAGGDASKFAKAASRATIGTVMLNTASHIRNSAYAGDHWYEVKIGNRQWDTRAFAPLSTYLFLAEAMQNPGRIKAADVASAVLSLNRVAGTGLVISDVLRGKTAETVMKPIERIAGEYLGSFTTPIRTLKDFFSTVDPNEAIIRDIREREMLGPSMRNIPGVSQTLPESKSPLRTTPMKTEGPLLRQLTGLSYRTKNVMEKELDSIDVDKSIIYPKTGVPKADRLITDKMAPIVEKLSGPVLSSPQYQKLDNLTKRVVWWSIFHEVKNESTKQVLAEDPQLASKIKVERIPNIITDLLKSRGIDLQKMIEQGAK